MSIAARMAELLEATSSQHVSLMKFLSGVADRLGVGQHVYVVGGAVRNFVIDQPIKDIDLVIDSVALGGKDSAWFATELSKVIPADTSLVTNNYGVAILSIKGEWELDGHPMQGEVIEIANAREESYGGAVGKGYKPSEVVAADIKADVKRREFTFNTLMWRLADLASGPDKAEIVDITGSGLADLKAGVMRTPSPPDKTFADDPTRMLRAIKFLVKYGFAVDKETADSIRRNAGKLKNAPPDAIASLLITAVLMEPSAKKALAEMDKLGLLDVVREMALTNKVFAATLSNWATNKKLAFLFELLDVGLPIKTPIDFLSPAEQARLRAVAVSMSTDEAEELLAALKQPGRALGDKDFIPKLAAQRGVPKGELKLFVPRMTAAIRTALLENPALLHQPEKLRALALSAVAEGSVYARMNPLLETLAASVDPSKPIKNGGYIAIILDGISRRRLLAWWEEETGLPMLDREFCHHVTLKYQPSQNDLEKYRLDTRASLRVVGWAASEGIQAVSVETDVPSANAVPHVTMSCAGSCKPSMSNDLMKHGVHSVAGPVVYGTVEYVVPGRKP